MHLCDALNTALGLFCICFCKDSDSGVYVMSFKRQGQSKSMVVASPRIILSDQ
jgi:hypothetical protein